MQNIEMEVVGEILVIKVDLTRSFGLSASGKSTIVATTSGNASPPGRPDVKIGLNVYKPKQK